MLRIDLTSLRVSELRSLLVTAQARGNEALAEQLEAELAARAAGRAPRPEPDPDPQFVNEDVLPIDVGPPLEDFTFHRPRPRRTRRGRWPVVSGVAAVVVTAGAALVWALDAAPGLPRAGSAAEPPPMTITPAQRAMTVRPAPAAPLPSAPLPAAAPEPPAEPAPAPARPEPTPPPRLDPCATPPSPADRLLCGDLALNLLEHEMRETYGRAIMAGADPIALRESQATWRRTRDPIADPRALAQAYDRRIRELEAQAAPPAP